MKMKMRKTMETWMVPMDVSSLAPTDEQIERERCDQMETLRIFRRGLLKSGHSPLVELFPLAGRMPVLR